MLMYAHSTSFPHLCNREDSCCCAVTVFSSLMLQLDVVLLSIFVPVRAFFLLQSSNCLPFILCCVLSGWLDRLTCHSYTPSCEEE